MILLDTQSLIWLLEGSRKLKSKARKTVEDAWSSGELAVSAISFWEIALLQSKKRVSMPEDVVDVRRRLFEEGLVEIKVDGETLIRAVQLENFQPDPADRIIVATAILKNCKLITADKHILKWRGKVERLSAGR